MPTDLMHYVRRPSMPLPTYMLEAIGLDPRRVQRDYTWTTLTDPERDQLAELFQPAAVGALTKRAQMFGTLTSRLGSVWRNGFLHAESTK